jgi:hypothetical protein
LVSVLALLLYSLKFLSLPSYLVALPVNLFLLLLLDFFLAVELVSTYSGGKEKRSAAKISKNIATDWSFLYP